MISDDVGEHLVTYEDAETGPDPPKFRKGMNVWTKYGKQPPWPGVIRTMGPKRYECQVQFFGLGDIR